MFGDRFYQFGYVTRDVEKAVNIFSKLYGMKLAIYDTVLNIRTAAGSDKISGRMGLGWHGGHQYELIEAHSGPVGFYHEMLADDCAPRLHHIGARVADLESALAEIAAQDLKIVMTGESHGVTFAYADTRHLIGHYMECIQMSDERWEFLQGVSAS